MSKKPESKKLFTRIVALALAGLMILTVLLAALASQVR